MAAAKKAPQAKKKPGGRALDPKVRQAIADELRTAEQPRQNAIAKKFNVSPSTVSKIAREEGVTFDRSATQKASQARAVDVDEKITRLADRMMDEAAALMDEMHSRYLVFNFGGRDNTYNEHELERPPIEARARMMTMAAIAIDKALKARSELRGDGAPESAFEAFLAFIGGTPPDDVESAEAG